MVSAMSETNANRFLNIQRERNRKYRMKTVLYAKGLGAIGETLGKMIHDQVPGMQVETCNSIGHFSQLLRQPLNKVSVVIFMAASRNELVQFNCMGLLFDNSRIILILPDRKKETLALGVKLKTSFVSYVDSDLQDIVSVLGQILKKNKGEETKWLKYQKQ